MPDRQLIRPPLWRRHVILAAMGALFILLGARVVHLQVSEHERLQAQGDARYLRQLTVIPARGRILDRNGQVLAVSTPVGSLWAEPAVFCKAQIKWQPLIDLAQIDEARLLAACDKHRQSDFRADFMYLKRRLPPMLAQQIHDSGIPGVGVQREYKRYYPGGPAGAHLIGFTDVDDVGQEGLEMAHESQLGGRAGRIRALKDRAGNYVERVENIQPVRHGRELTVSVDQRIQSLANDYLARAVRDHRAVGGSVVVLAVPSGEILAMVNAPQFNPNDRATLRADAFRNRSITDLLEPGSSAKPFTAAMALDGGAVGATTMVDTTPGRNRVGGHVIRDNQNHGILSVGDVITRSSNVGISKIAMAFPYDDLYDAFAGVGFGRRAANLPGESAGPLKWRNRPVEHATLSYGYGVSVTPLQLARAYTVFATDGELLPVTLVPQADGYRAQGERVFSADTAHAIRAMLERAAGIDGTAPKARIARYRVGGKTGTIHKLIDGVYDQERYVSVFAGIAPITAPRFVVVVSIDDPRGEFYYGGDVAAPVFAALMADLMRLYNIKPDGAGDST